MTPFVDLISSTWSSKRGEYEILPLGGERYGVSRPAERRIVFEGTRDEATAWIDRQCAEAVAGVIAKHPAAIAAILPPGWKAMPEEPTEEMLEEFCAEHHQHFRKVREAGYRPGPGDVAKPCWRAMIAAAPTPPTAAEEKHDG